jgi:urease accessory protein
MECSIGAGGNSRRSWRAAFAHAGRYANIARVTANSEADMLAKWMRRVALAAPFILIVSEASAHHVMGGKTPATFAEGILSGLGHPIIGPDHLAFLVALGVAVGVFRLSLVNPFLFLVAMGGGVAAHVAAVALPGAEIVVAVSVLLAGVLLAVERDIPAGWWTALFVLAGFFHGYAYGESIFGAERTPLAAYLIGLVVVQTALTIGVALATRALWKASALAPRLAGAAVGGVGFAALVAQIVPAP